MQPHMLRTGLRIYEDVVLLQAKSFLRFITGVVPGFQVGKTRFVLIGALILNKGKFIEGFYSRVNY